MKKEEMNLIKKAYGSYNLNGDEKISNKVLKFVKKRLLKNQKDLETLIEVFKEKISFEDFISCFEKEMEEPDLYKKEKVMKKVGEEFYYGTYTTSVGNILVETTSPLSTLKYFVKGIKSRNSITISDIEYHENDLKNAILLIFKNALEKYNVDANLLNIIPFEECSNEMFDKVIYEDERKVVSNKIQTEYSYIYLENEDFASMAVNDLSRLSNRGRQVEILKGEFGDVINRINSEKTFSACIYTENRDLAYNFINLAQASNVFVNASLDEAEKLENIEDEFYTKKKIMYPIN